jgi:mRNA-degrading endonuclease toxin of MazEF toxin-antitoxin module
VTRTIRRTPGELSVGTDEGLPVDSVANFDGLSSVPKSMLVRRLGRLGPRAPELCDVLGAMAGC